jgi:hypothetical protein
MTIYEGQWSAVDPFGSSLAERTRRTQYCDLATGQLRRTPLIATVIFTICASGRLVSPIARRRFVIGDRSRHSPKFAAGMLAQYESSRSRASASARKYAYRTVEQ